MNAALQALLEPQSPRAHRLAGLRWVYALAAAVQLFNLALFGWAIPPMPALEGAGLVLAGVGIAGLTLIEVLKRNQLKSGRPVALAQAAMLDGFALGLALLLSVFALRMGLGFWSLGFAGLGLAWYLVGFLRLALRL
ncbi:hypothetical protein [uncultured Meiothermus sp.]|jgi:hypothetical protein|uniref:hypothetical protein n=1 Tax=uncultured Meiothermus sp. TaxID=157471 RepID=UPI00263A0018|nr:hypothetical protein [uncultured Meiothermus sp.]